MDNYMASIAAQKLDITDARDMARLIKVAQAIHEIDVIRTNGFKDRRQEKYYEKRLDDLTMDAMCIVNPVGFKVASLVVNIGDPRLAPIYVIPDFMRKFNAWLEQPWNAELKDAWQSDDTERQEYVKLRYQLSRHAIDGVAIY